MDETFDIRKMAEYLRGEATGPYQVSAPGPGRPETDRSLLVWFDHSMEDEPFVFSFADDDPQVCLDYVLSSLARLLSSSANSTAFALTALHFSTVDFK